VTIFFQMYRNVQFCKVPPSLPEFILLGCVCPQQCFFKVLISSFSPMFPIHLGETILCHMYIRYKSYYFYMNPNNSYSRNNVNYNFTYPQAFIFIKQWATYLPKLLTLVLIFLLRLPTSYLPTHLLLAT